LYGHSSKPKECKVVGDIAEFFFNPIVAIIKASKGPKYEDSKEYQMKKEVGLEKQIQEYERDIAELHAIIFIGTFDDQTTTDDYNSQTSQQTKNDKTCIPKRKIKPF
jgi:hypothetical protein